MAKKISGQPVQAVLNVNGAHEATPAGSQKVVEVESVRIKVTNDPGTHHEAAYISALIQLLGAHIGGATHLKVETRNDRLVRQMRGHEPPQGSSHIALNQALQTFGELFDEVDYVWIDKEGKEHRQF